MSVVSKAMEYIILPPFRAYYGFRTWWFLKITHPPKRRKLLEEAQREHDERKQL